MPRLITSIFILTFLFSIVAPPAPTAAQSCSRLNWGETSTRAFTFTYQKSVPLGVEIAAQYGDRLDAEYSRFANLFQVSLNTPITVRIYPNGTDYTCLNALAPNIPIGQTHSHIGEREIALIGQYILADPEGWQINAFDVLRHELAILFVQHLTGGKAPLGLTIGVGIYAEDPALTFERRLASAPPPTYAPSLSWRGVWEAPDVITSPDVNLQAASIVAYLVDVYGWDKFVAFLSTLRTAESYHAALTAVYKVEAGALEEQWLTYYPLYFEGRWRDNALYEFSLSAYEQLITAGAYQAATDGLTPTIALLTQRGDQSDLLAQAQALYETAAIGLEADALARQSRQAYQESDYPAAADFAAQALGNYAPLNDTRNQETLLTIQSRAEEILTLRAELDTLQTGLTPAASSRLLEIAPRLGELGDTEGQAQADQLIIQITRQRQDQAITVAVAGAGIGLVLLILRIALTKRRPPPEVLVQY